MPDLQIKGIEAIKQRYNPARFSRAIQFGMELMARDMTERVRMRTPQGKTGKLRKNIRIVRRGEMFLLESPEPYSGFVERGTKPHMIYPRRAKAMRFEAGGRLVFSKSVRHPGTKGAHMFENTMRQDSRRFMDILSKGVMLYLESGR